MQKYWFSYNVQYCGLKTNMCSGNLTFSEHDSDPTFMGCCFLCFLGFFLFKIRRKICKLSLYLKKVKENRPLCNPINLIQVVTWTTLVSCWRPKWWILPVSFKCLHIIFYHTCTCTILCFNNYCQERLNWKCQERLSRKY